MPNILRIAQSIKLARGPSFGGSTRESIERHLFVNALGQFPGESQQNDASRLEAFPRQNLGKRNRRKYCRKPFAQEKCAS